MAIKAIVTKEEREALAEPLKALYVEKEGKFILEAEGIDDLPQVGGLKSALQKEREANKKSAADLKEFAEKFKDVDPEKAREALKKVQELEDKTLIDQGKVDELFKKRTEQMQADHDSRIKTFDTKLKEREAENLRLNGRLSEVLIEDALRQVALKPEIGLKPTAVRDIVLRSRTVWKLKDGKPVPEQDGSIIYGKDPNAPMSMEEWIVSQRADSPHLFGESGGAADGSKPKGGGKNLNKKRSEMNAIEKTAFIGEHGQEAYFALPA